MLKDIESVYSDRINNLKLQTNDILRSNSKRRALVDISLKTLQHLEEEKGSLNETKDSLDMEIEGIMRELKEKDEEKQNLLSLKAMELAKLKELNE